MYSIPSFSKLIPPQDVGKHEKMEILKKKIGKNSVSAKKKGFNSDTDTDIEPRFRFLIPKHGGFGHTLCTSTIENTYILCSLAFSGLCGTETFDCVQHGHGDWRPYTTGPESFCSRISIPSISLEINNMDK